MGRRLGLRQRPDVGIQPIAAGLFGFYQQRQRRGRADQIVIELCQRLAAALYPLCDGCFGNANSLRKVSLSNEAMGIPRQPSGAIRIKIRLQLMRDPCRSALERAEAADIDHGDPAIMGEGDFQRMIGIEDEIRSIGIDLGARRGRARFCTGISHALWVAHVSARKMQSQERGLRQALTRQRTGLVGNGPLENTCHRPSMALLKIEYSLDDFSLRQVRISAGNSQDLLAKDLHETRGVEGWQPRRMTCPVERHSP